jgi:hypothetical protein
MPLPKIKHPIHEFTIPSIRKKELFRPFLVREEKILLIAKASGDQGDILRAVKQVVNNCAINKSFDIDKIAIFDVEYLFLRLRAVSINNMVKVSYIDNEDTEVYDFEIDLLKIEVKFPEKVDQIIKVDDKITIVMKHPPASLFDDKDFANSGEDVFYELILRCIDKIYEGDDVYDPSEYSREEIEEFLNDLDVDVFEKIQTFMSNMPKLYHRIEYKNKNQKDRVIELTSLADFFMLG